MQPKKKLLTEDEIITALVQMNGSLGTALAFLLEALGVPEDTLMVQVKQIMYDNNPESATDRLRLIMETYCTKIKVQDVQ